MDEFNPARITLAQQVRGWDGKELAARCGMSATHLTRLRRGETPFTEKWARRVAFETGFPLTFLILHDPPIDPQSLTFRRLSKMPKRKTMQVAGEFRLLAGAIGRLATMTGTAPDTRWLDALSPTSDPTPRDIERIAHDVRSHWGVGDGTPVGDLTRGIERDGIPVVPMATRMDDILGDGVTDPARVHGNTFIGYFPEGKTGDRQRFTVAHELGHLVLHRNRRPGDRHLAEREANMFAGALLMPETDARRLLAPDMTLGEYPAIKAGWGVSVAALIGRAFNLGIIDTERRRSLMMQLAARRWNRREPVAVADEHPTLLAQLVGGAFGGLEDYEHPVVSKDTLQGFLGLPFDLVDYWCGGCLRVRVEDGPDGLL